MTCVAIHQPEYFPWLGYLDKARRADVFVLLDDVQFDRSSQQHRARVAGANGPVWLTIPFQHKFPQRIDEVAAADDRWRAKHWKTLQACYGRAAGWKDAAPRLEAFFSRPHPRVVDAALGSVALLFEAFGVGTRVVRSSELGIGGQKAELVLDICRALGGILNPSTRAPTTAAERLPGSLSSSRTLLRLRSAISNFGTGRIRGDQLEGLRINVRANTCSRRLRPLRAPGDSDLQRQRGR